jgi:hypothetical protein
MVVLLSLLLRIVSSFGDDLDETLPSEVPFRLRAANEILKDSSMLAICEDERMTSLISKKYMLEFIHSIT